MTDGFSKLSLKISRFILRRLGESDWRQRSTASANWALILLVATDLILPDKWKPTYFLFVDETVNNQTNVSCFTSLYISQKQYSGVRKDVYEVHRKIKDKLNLGLYADTVELHGKDLLKNYTEVDDQFRFEIFKDFVSIINKHKIHVVRIGYNNSKEIANSFKGENQKLYGLHMMNFCGWLNLKTRINKVLVIMDSTNQEIVKVLSRMLFVQTSNALIFPDQKHSFIIEKPQNIIESVCYVDSRYSEVMQLTDLIGYLFNKMDYKKNGMPLNPFANALCSIGEGIKSELIINQIIKMNLGNQHPS